MTKAEMIKELVAAGKAMLEQDRINRHANAHACGAGFVAEGQAAKDMRAVIARAEK